MAARQPLPPTFTPRSGWYRPGLYAPGSARDLQAMAEAAIPATVVVLRRRGVRIPPEQLLASEAPSGLLVCLDRYTSPRWYACLFADQAIKRELLPRLLHAELERENGGVRLFGGIEADGNQQHRQAWLCTPTPERAREVLLAWLEERGGPM